MKWFCAHRLIAVIKGVAAVIAFIITMHSAAVWAQDTEERPAVFKAFIIQGKQVKEVVGILKMHFKKKFEAAGENGLVILEYNKIKEIVPVDAKKQKVKMTLVSGETIEVKLINHLYLDKTVFGKYELHLNKVKKIVRQENE